MFVYQGGNRLLDPLTLEPKTKGWYFEITGKDVQFHETLGLQYVVLETMSSTIITLTVHAPWEGELSEFTQIVVEANSGTDPWARDSLLTTTNLEILLDFSVQWDVEPWEEDPDDPRYGMKYVELNPSGTERIKILVKNKGNLNDTYALEIKGIIDTWGAGFTEDQLETYTISLDAGIFYTDPDWKGSEIEIDVYITIASDAQAGDISNLKVICTSLNSKESTFIEILTREDILIVNTKPENELDLSCDESQKYVNPGNNISFTITAENKGNAEIDLLIEHSEISVMGWEVEHITEISIYPDSKQRFDVEITSPFDALAGDKLIVTIKGSIIEDGLVKGSDTVALVAIIHNCCWIESDVSPSSQIVNPGDEVEYFITIYNKGNGNDFIKISPFIIKVDWGDVTFEYNGDEFYNSVEGPLEWMENITIPVRFTIPSEELAGSFITTFNVTALKGSVLINVETVVNQMFDLNLLGYKDVTNEFVNSLTMDISPGWTESFLFKLTNKGNAPETIELELDGLEQEEGEWRGYFSDVANTMIYTTNIQPYDFTKIIDMQHKPAEIAYLNADNTDIDSLKLHLGIDQTVYVKAKVSAPTGLPEGEFKIFTVNVISEQPELEDPVDNEVKINLDILFADLIVDNIGHPRDLKDGKIITISAYVKNIGDIEARDVFIILYIDDKEIKSIQMTTISKGTDNLLITFNWQATGGQHKIKIEVDPENKVVEKNDQFRGINNNVATNNIDVASDGLFDAGVSRAICSLLPILIAVITMAILIVLWKKRGMFRFRE
jgi:uncharacterized membrane protein